MRDDLVQSSTNAVKTDYLFPIITIFKHLNVAAAEIHLAKYQEKQLVHICSVTT